MKFFVGMGCVTILLDFDGDLDHDVDTEIFKQTFYDCSIGQFDKFIW